jgi:hypothetical protein
MPISRAAAEIEPVRWMASSKSALPGPIADSSPYGMRILRNFDDMMVFDKVD